MGRTVYVQLINEVDTTNGIQWLKSAIKKFPGEKNMHYEQWHQWIKNTTTHGYAWVQAVYT